MKYNEIFTKKWFKLKKSFDDYNVVWISVMRGILFSLLIFYSFLINNF